MKCLLHIGTEKTGTTVLQEWLYANREALSERGLYLPIASGVPNSRKFCAFCQDAYDDYFRARSIDDEQARRAYFDGFIQELADELELARASHDAVLLTSEHFSSRLKSQEEIACLKDVLQTMLGPASAIDIVCYVREQASLINSLYSTALLNGSTASIRDFYTDPSIHDPYFNYELMLQNWSAVFGSENVKLRLYDRAKLTGGDVRQDFLAVVLPNAKFSDFNPEKSTSNTAISQLQTLLLRLINQFGPLFEKEGGFNGNRSEMVDLVTGNKLLEVGVVRQDGRENIRLKFQVPNVNLFRRYLGVEDNLFFEESAPPSKEECNDLVLDYGQQEALLQTLEALFRDLKSNTSHEPSIRLEPNVIDFFRDVALKYESGEPVSKHDAVRLMEFAQKGRPEGHVIQRFLKDHR